MRKPQQSLAYSFDTYVYQHQVTSTSLQDGNTAVLLHLLIEVFYAARTELLEERTTLLTEKGKMLEDTYLGKKYFHTFTRFEFIKDHFLFCMAFNICKSFLSIYFKMIYIHLILVQ